MELAAATLHRAVLIAGAYLIETVSPVNTHQTDHRQEDTDTDASRTLHVEGVELLGVSPSVTAFHESQTVDGGVAQHERVAQFQCEAVVGIGIIRRGSLALSHSHVSCRL